MDQIIALAKQLLPQEVDEDKLAFCADDVQAYICSFCNTGAIPEGCETLAAKMIAADYDGSLADASLKSVTRGDFSASYDTAGREGFHSFDQRLARFRRLKW